MSSGPRLFPRWSAALALWVLAAQRGDTRTIEGTVRVTGGGSLPAVVYLPSEREAGPADTALIDQRQLAYVPAVTVVRPRSVVQFRNSDPVVHNVFSPTRATGRFDLGRYGPDKSHAQVFAQPGAALILCRIHPEMFAYVLVVSATAWVVTDRDGRFRLDRVPVGRTEVVAWHPRAGMRRVPVEPGAGPLEITLGRP